MPRATRSRVGLVFLTSWILVNIAAADAPGQAVATSPGDLVTVELASGRRFTAEVGAKTDRSTLWLQQSLTSGYLARPIDWSHVVRVESDGQVVSGEEFRRAVTASVPLPSPDFDVSTTSIETPRPFDIVLGPTQREASPAEAGPRAETRVSALAIQARLANWDADVEPDGFLVEVFPLDSQGATIPVHASLDVDLTGQRVGVLKRPEPFDRLARWTRQVDPADFGPHGASYRLPFQSVHPEFDLRWGSYGTLHARLSVPGSGVFEQTESTVRLRPYSAIRDQLEQTRGRRYFAFERTGGENP